jgi:hypothetical protein
MSTDASTERERRFPRARRGFWIGFGLGALNFAINPVFWVLALSRPAMLFKVLSIALVVGGLGAGLGALFDLSARHAVRTPALVLILLVPYVTGYYGARRSLTLVHRTTHAHGVVSHSVVLGDPGMFGAFPLLRFALGVLYFPATMAESMAWTLVADVRRKTFGGPA